MVGPAGWDQTQPTCHPQRARMTSRRARTPADAPDRARVSGYRPGADRLQDGAGGRGRAPGGGTTWPCRRGSRGRRPLSPCLPGSPPAGSWAPPGRPGRWIAGRVARGRWAARARPGTPAAVSCRAARAAQAPGIAARTGGTNASAQDATGRGGTSDNNCYVYIRKTVFMACLSRRERVGYQA